MKTTIPYCLNFVCHSKNNATPTNDERAKLRDLIAAAILDDSYLSALRLDRFYRPGGMNSLEEDHWKPPLRPLLLTAFDFDLFPDEPLSGRMIGLAAPSAPGMFDTL